MPTIPVIKKNGQIVVEIPDTAAAQPAATAPADVKKGKTTTEALATLVGAGIAVAAATGYLTPGQADAAQAASGELIGVVSAVALPAVYTICRTLLKIVHIWKG
jgi:hypothetical protein